jgi:hypothetical protein
MDFGCYVKDCFKCAWSVNDSHVAVRFRLQYNLNHQLCSVMLIAGGNGDGAWDTVVRFQRLQHTTAWVYGLSGGFDLEGVGGYLSVQVSSRQ